MGIGIGGIAVGVLSASMLVFDQAKFRRVAIVAAIIAIALNVAYAATLVGKPGYLVLVRDIIAAAIMAAGITFLVWYQAIVLSRSGTIAYIRVIIWRWPRSMNGCPAQNSRLGNRSGS